MKSTDVMERLHEEIRKATEYVKLLEGTKGEKILKAYIVGIQFAINVIIGATANSILEGADKIMEDK